VTPPILVLSGGPVYLVHSGLFVPQSSFQVYLARIRKVIPDLRRMAQPVEKVGGCGLRLDGW
jgi:hypothetical protein